VNPVFLPGEYLFVIVEKYTKAKGCLAADFLKYSRVL